MAHTHNYVLLQANADNNDFTFLCCKIRSPQPEVSTQLLKERLQLVERMDDLMSHGLNNICFGKTPSFTPNSLNKELKTQGVVFPTLMTTCLALATTLQCQTPSLQICISKYFSISCYISFFYLFIWKMC